MRWRVNPYHAYQSCSNDQEKQLTEGGVELSLLIAIEGIDGSGKGTQAERLQSALQEVGTRAALLSFPRYDDTLFGKSIGDFLNGRFGQLNEVSPFLAALLYAGDRFESRSVLRNALETHEVVILDRYVASNIAHQGAKVDGAERSEIIAWIERIEYEIYQLPRPDRVIFLDLPVERAQTLIQKKEARTYTDQKADLQEADGGYLGRVRAVYSHLADTQPNWDRVNCLTASRELRTIDDIGVEVRTCVERLLASE